VTRTAADVGAGLSPARAARSIRSGERIHVIGVAGAGASAAALLADAAGAVVSGCDSGGPSPYSPAVEAAGVAVEWRHDPAHVTGLPRPDRIAVTKALTSVDPDHAELSAARSAGIPLQPWQQVVADAAVGRTLVAVAGTHGKSTTAGWLTHALVAVGRDPSAFVGALLPPGITGGPPATARSGAGDEFVVEADEYAGNFDAYRPAVAVVTNIDFDHPDVFTNRAAVVEALAEWLAAVPAATLVVNVGDRGAAELVDRLAGHRGRIVRAALEATSGRAPADAEARIVHASPDSTQISLRLPSGPRLDVALPTAGAHNVANGLLVAATADVLGLTPGEIALALRSFTGVGRRLERKGDFGGVVVYDDYGHHPTAIRATIEAVRQREPGRRLWVACEPLTYHRTAALLDGLAAALARADGIAVADIWPGRDPDRTIASSARLAASIARVAAGKLVAAPGDVDATADWLVDRVAPGDVVLVMGGGHSYRIGERLLGQLRTREASEPGH
jgi:UDP-N-acetylmuramate--alanine ligase